MARFIEAVTVSVVGLAALAAQPVAAQDWTRREFPLAPPNSRANFVAPYFDGFFTNPDGSHTLSFGFMNRNEEDLIEIPLGPNNFIEPREFDGMQPTTFPVVSYGGFGGPRERGTFAVTIPADFEGDVWWTLTTNGVTTKVPGRTHTARQGLIGFEAAYEMSWTPQAEGSLRPTVRFAESGPEGIGIKGIESPQRLTTSVGRPVEVRFWAFDRGERDLREVNMTLWKHQGPVGGVISFESLVEAAPPAEGAADGRGAGPGGAAAGAGGPPAAAGRGRGGRGGRG
ncbi:MAG: hypothetical protein FJ207_07680, partial [Gemmatimonadetes bacterium]|nr:hypothetical protein [Gemmatimonadota bacterium]